MRTSSAPTSEARSDSRRASWSRATTKIRRMASDRSLRRARPDRAAALEVLHHPLEALVELDLRHVPQHAPGLVDVRLAVPDVSGPAFSKPPADPPAHEQLELAHDVEQADPRSAGDVEDLAARPVRVGGQDVGLDHVLDLGEVARLRAVTVDLHGPAFERGQNELRNDGRVLRRRVLTRPEDVEVAQADGLHAIERSEEHTSELQSLTNLVCR